MLCRTHRIFPLSCSSIGLAKAALESINGENLFGGQGASWSVIYVDIDAHNRNRTIFDTILPRESNSKVALSRSAAVGRLSAALSRNTAGLQWQNVRACSQCMNWTGPNCSFHTGVLNMCSVRRVFAVLYYYFASAAVAVDSSHMTALSSSSFSRFNPPSNFVNVLTVWFMVCHSKMIGRDPICTS